MGSFVANPLSGLIEGLLQGHQLGQQLHRQKQEDIAFKTNQALHQQQMSIQDIMNKQMLQEQARPVSQAGTIDNPAVKGPASPVPGLPDEAGVPAYSRPADAARTVNYGGGQYELKTPEEKEQSTLDRTIKTNDALELAKGEQAQRVRQSVLKMRGVELPSDIGQVLRMPTGTMVLPEEIPGLAQHAMEVVKGGYHDLGPGHKLVAPNTPGLDPGFNAPGNGRSPDPGFTTPGNGRSPDPGFHTIAEGGAPPLTGEFATVYLPKFAASLGKKPEDLTLDELQAGLGKFKEANADPEVRAATIAGKNAANATRELADTMKRAQLGQMPTQEDAARMAEHIRNHELAPSQLTEIRGRGNGSLGVMIEREMSKSDPHFNWQQADADYNYSKSPNLQTTVRLMDSALNSIPRMQQAANKLAMGGVRSVNSLVKLGKNQFNDIDLKRFQTDATLVGDEIGKIIQGGGTGSGVSDSKLKQAQDLLRDTDSPKAIATALEEVNAIIGYRRQAVTRGTYLEGRQPMSEGGGGAAAGGKPPLSSFEKK